MPSPQHHVRAVKVLGRSDPRGHWQRQEAKQHFSELIRSVETEGPQVVTRHGEEVAVVVGIAEYRRLRGAGSDFMAIGLCPLRLM
jgi:prevent-host-death family protein